MENKFKTLLFGKPRSLSDRSVFHQLSLVAFFAWVGLGTDGLSSSCYGPPEAYKALAGFPHLGIFVALGTVITIFVISASYSQIIDLFPSGGGGYLVASKLLSPTAGMVSGCLLLVDYVLTISVSITAATHAFLNLVPEYAQWQLPLAAAGILVLIVINMRGVKESILTLVPIFLVFLLTHVFIVGYSIVVNGAELPRIAGDTANTVRLASDQKGTWGMVVMVLLAYCMGAGTFTGIEAVSNGMSMLREPRAKTAKSTMRYMAWSLSFMAMGLMVAYILFGMKPDYLPKTLNGALVETMSAGWNPYVSKPFVMATVLSEAAILYVAAQTGFLSGPRVAANMAMDRWLPTRLAILSDRLVTSNGVVMMGAAALAVLLLTNGNIEIQIAIYSICVFTTFVMSLLGMVRHWFWARGDGKAWKRPLLISGLGMALSLAVLVTIIVLRFHEGGWIALVITGSLVLVACLIRLHYKRVQALLARLNVLVGSSEKQAQQFAASGKPLPAYDPRAKTAVLFVSGFNGIGLHSLLNTIRFFGDSFGNFIFVQVGMIDAGNFKGAEEIQHLRAYTNRELEKYVNFCRSSGYFADSYAAIGVDLIEEIDKLAPEILRKYPEAVFFGGQLVFPQDSVFSRWLHNATVFAIQRRFYTQGVPFMVLPIRV